MKPFPPKRTTTGNISIFFFLSYHFRHPPHNAEVKQDKKKKVSSNGEQNKPGRRSRSERCHEIRQNTPTQRERREKMEKEKTKKKEGATES